MFYVRKCKGFRVLRRWCVYCTAGEGTQPVVIQDHHVTYASAQSEADRLNG